MAVIPTHSLIKMLEQVILHLKAKDSVEGSLSYTRFGNDVDLRQDEFECAWIIRYGNSQGQGGCWALPESEGSPQSTFITQEKPDITQGNEQAG